MASSIQLQNREDLSVILQKVIREEKDFDINSINCCALSYYYEEKKIGRYDTNRISRWDPDFVAEHFGITEKAADDLFALSGPEAWKGDKNKQTDAFYNTDRIMNHFRNN